MLFQGVGKTDGYLNTYYVMPSNQGGTFRKEHIDFACAANPGGVTPRLTSANKNNWYDSSFWMKSAAYLRLKNIQLGYDLPKSWMRKIGLKSAYVYVNAQNLFTATNFWDGYDPEVGYDGDASGDFDLVKLGSANNYPQVKLVTIGPRSQILMRKPTMKKIILGCSAVRTPRRRLLARQELSQRPERIDLPRIQSGGGGGRIRRLQRG